MIPPGWLTSLLPAPEARRVRQWTTTQTVTLPDGPAALARLPGVRAYGPAQQAAAAAVRRMDARRVCVLGPGAAALALWAGRSGAHVTAWHDSLSEALATEASFTANQMEPPEIVCGWQADRLPQQICDLALVQLPRGRDLQTRLLEIAGAVLAPEGRLVFTGAKNEGFGSALTAARDRFGQAGIVAHKGGYQAALAVSCPSPAPREDFRATIIEIAGEPTELISCSGVFAAGRLDAGAAALIAGMEIDAASNVLDLGCGTGLAGLVALRRGARVTGADVSAAAVASTRRTWDANGYPDASVHLSVGAACLPDGAMDMVITNPPFHRGRDVNFEVAQLFVAEAARVLSPGGRLYLVANAFLDYAGWLARAFRDVGIAWQSAQFRVWYAQK